MHLVIGLLALEYGLINERVFVAVVSAAIFSSIILGPWLSSALSRRKRVEVGEFLPRTGAVLTLEAEDVEEAVRALCAAAAGHLRLEADALLSQVMERERLMSTAVGKGVAFPHARLEGLKRPLILLGRTHDGLDWNTPDRDPVHLVFLILTPLDDRDVQVQILASLATLMAGEGVTDRLLKSRSEKEIIGFLKGRAGVGKPPAS
jgi:mannitol/fructose-specific phosphotransferase system IIA component (Ntr-type)